MNRMNWRFLAILALALALVAAACGGDDDDAPPVVVNRLPVRLELSLGATTPWPVDPDLLEQNHAADLKVSMELSLSTGQMERVAINLT